MTYEISKYLLHRDFEKSKLESLWGDTYKSVQLLK